MAQRILIFLLVVTVGVGSLWFHEYMECEAKTKEAAEATEAAGIGALSLAQNKEKEVEAFMIAFYEAHTKEKFASIVDSMEGEEELSLYITRYETMFNYGFQKYENISMDIYSLEWDNYWLVYVRSDIVVEGASVKLPELIEYLVHKGEDGAFRVVLNSSDDSVPDTVRVKMGRIEQTEEVADKIAEHSFQYDEICKEHPEVQEWVYDVSERAVLTVAESIIEKEAVEEQEKIEAVKELMKAYYEAHTKEGLVSIANYIEDEENLQSYITRYETMMAYGVIKYDNIDVDVYPLYQGEYWFAHVYSDMIVEGLDVGLPGMMGYFVHEGEDGKLRIILEDSKNSDISEELYDKLIQEARQINQRDEVIDKVTACAAKYSEICAENPEAAEWALETADAIHQALAAANDEGKDNYLYTVQKGDCLWSIAEKELGNGMYWGRIYEKNKSIIGNDPDLLFVGIQLQLDE